ncbi:unnamed protein product [Prunus brigantina]
MWALPTRARPKAKSARSPALAHDVHMGTARVVHDNDAAPRFTGIGFVVGLPDESRLTNSKGVRHIGRKAAKAKRGSTLNNDCANCYQ